MPEDQPITGEEVKNLLDIRKDVDELGNIKKSLTKENLQLLIRTIAPSLKEEQFYLFMFQARKLGLNPLMGELIGYNSKTKVGENWVDKLTIIVPRDGKRKIASRLGVIEWVKRNAIYIKTEKVEGQPDKVVKCEPWEGGTLWGAECTIKVKTMEEPVKVTVLLSEYDTQQNLWAKKKDTMIQKVAESHALSLVISELSGIYDESEIDFENTPKSAPTLEDGNAPATPQQVVTLQSLGVEPREGITKQEAVDLITNNIKK